MYGLEYAPFVVVVAAVACFALGISCCALAGVLHLVERAAVKLAPLRAPRA